MPAAASMPAYNADLGPSPQAVSFPGTSNAGNVSSHPSFSGPDLSASFGPPNMAAASSSSSLGTHPTTSHPGDTSISSMYAVDFHDLGSASASSGLDNTGTSSGVPSSFRAFGSAAHTSAQASALGAPGDASAYSAYSHSSSTLPMHQALSSGPSFQHAPLPEPQLPPGGSDERRPPHPSSMLPAQHPASSSGPSYQHAAPLEPQLPPGGSLRSADNPSRADLSRIATVLDPTRARMTSHSSGYNLHKFSDMRSYRYRPYEDAAGESSTSVLAAGASGTTNALGTSAPEPRDLGPPPVRMAPEVPAAVLAALNDKTRHTRMRATMRADRDGGPNAPKVKARLAEIMRISAEHHEYENPNTRRARQSTMLSWGIYLEAQHPEINQEHHWRDTTAKDFGCSYLLWRVENSVGTKGRRHVKSATVQSWVTNFMHCVCKYVKSSDGQSTGMTLLTTHRFSAELENKANHIIQTYDLDRTGPDKLYFGRAEFQLIIDAAMEGSVSSGRLQAVQTIVVASGTFYASFRPSTVGWNSKEFLERGRYMKLGSLKVLNRAKATWDILLHPTNFKGYNGVTGSEQKWTFQAVKLAHNVSFCPGMWFVSYLFLRGALMYDTLEEVFNAKEAVLAIKPSMVDEPLFLAGTPGGRNLVKGKPASSTHLSASVQKAAHRAGLRGGSLGCWRADTGNDYGIKAGGHVADIALNHRDRMSTYDTHYSRGTNNIPVVGLRLGELIPPQDSEYMRASLHMHMFTSEAVACMVFRSAMQELLGDGLVTKEPKFRGGAPKNNKELIKVKLSQDVLDEIESDKELLLLEAKLADCWETFFACFSKAARTFPCILQEVNRIKKCQTVRLIRPDALPQAEQMLRVASKAASKRRTKVRRPHLDAARKKGRNDVLNADGVDTFARRDKAIAELQKPMSLIDKFVPSSASVPQSAPAPSHFPSTSSTLIMPSTSDGVSNESHPPYGEHDPELDPVNLVFDINRDVDISVEWDPLTQSIVEEDPSLFLTTLPGVVPDLSGSSLPEVPTSTEEWQALKDTLSGMCPLGDDCDSDGEFENTKGQELRKMIAARVSKGKGKQRATKKGTKEKTVPPTASESESQPQVVPRPQVGSQPCSPEAEGYWLASEPPANPNHLEENELDAIRMPAWLLRMHGVAYICKPVLEERKLQKQFNDDGQRWICQICKDFKHDVGLHMKDYKAKSHLERHMLRHTPWFDLELQMIPSDEDDDFYCPSCDFSAPTLEEVRKHCLSDNCKDVAKYQAMYEEDLRLGPVVETGKKKRPGRERRERAERKADSDYSEEADGDQAESSSEESDPRPAQSTSRRVRKAPRRVRKASRCAPASPDASEDNPEPAPRRVRPRVQTSMASRRVPDSPNASEDDVQPAPGRVRTAARRVPDSPNASGDDHEPAPRVRNAARRVPASSDDSEDDPDLAPPRVREAPPQVQASPQLVSNALRDAPSLASSRVMSRPASNIPPHVSLPVSTVLRPAPGVLRPAPATLQLVPIASQNTPPVPTNVTQPTDVRQAALHGIVAGTGLEESATQSAQSASEPAPTASHLRPIAPLPKRKAIRPALATVQPVVEDTDDDFLMGLFRENTVDDIVDLIEPHRVHIPADVYRRSLQTLFNAYDQRDILPRPLSKCTWADVIKEGELY